MKKYLLIMLAILCCVFSACNLLIPVDTTYEIVFRNGNEQLAKIVLDVGQTLSATDSRIPSLPTETGYVFSWDKDVGTISSNAVVNVVKTANIYTVTLDANGGEMGYTEFSVTYGQPFSIDDPFEGRDAKGFAGWFYDGVLIDTTKEWNIASDVTLRALWQEGSHWSDWYN